MLEHRVDLAALRRDVGHVTPGDHDPSGRRVLEPGDHPQRRRLPAAAGADQREELACPQVEVRGCSPRGSSPNAHEMPSSLTAAVVADCIAILRNPRRPRSRSRRSLRRLRARDHRRLRQRSPISAVASENVTSVSTVTPAAIALTSGVTWKRISPKINTGSVTVLPLRNAEVITSSIEKVKISSPATIDRRAQQRQGDPPEGAPRAGAEIASGLLERRRQRRDPRLDDHRRVGGVEHDVTDHDRRQPQRRS